MTNCTSACCYDIIYISLFKDGIFKYQLQRMNEARQRLISCLSYSSNHVCCIISHYNVHFTGLCSMYFHDILQALTDVECSMLLMERCHTKNCIFLIKLVVDSMSSQA